LANLSLKDWTLRIRRKKGSLETLQRVQPNSEKLLDCRRALTEWLAVRPASAGAYLFTSRNGGALSRIQVYRLFRQYAEQAGLPDSKRGVHALKHTLGQRMADLGIDIKEMREAMGHKHLTSTQAYFSIRPAQADAARQVALASRM